MQLRGISLSVADEKAIVQHRLALLKEFFNAKLVEKLPPNIVREDDTELDPNVVSLLNLRSLKRDKLVSLGAFKKLGIILSDVKLLRGWIQNYKSDSADSVKIATFFEAGMRLKMELDHSDFDEGELRTKRRNAISEIDEILKGVNVSNF